MKNVELIRGRVVRGLDTEVRRLRAYISTTEGNSALFDKMDAEFMQLLLAELTDLTMRRLGHEIKTPLADARSRVRQAVARVRA